MRGLMAAVATLGIASTAIVPSASAQETASDPFDQFVTYAQSHCTGAAQEWINGLTTKPDYVESIFVIGQPDGGVIALPAVRFGNFWQVGVPLNGGAVLLIEPVGPDSPEYHSTYLEYDKEIFKDFVPPAIDFAQCAAGFHATIPFSYDDTIGLVFKSEPDGKVVRVWTLPPLERAILGLASTLKPSTTTATLTLNK